MKINVNNVTINYITEGQGKALILLHGNGEDHHVFDKLIEKLKTDFTVYALDSRNHGESSKTNDISYQVMSNDVFEFIKHLNIQKPLLVGFSDGAIIGLTLSLEHANIFEKMVLLGVNLKPTDFKETIYAYLEEEYENTQDLLIGMMLEQPNIELESLKTISTPSLVIGGEDDLYDLHLFESIAEVMPNAQLKIMQGHDHGSYIIDTDILYPDLKSFLS